MIKIVFAFLVCLLLGCENTSKQVASKRQIQIDTLQVLKNDLVLNQVEGIWYYNSTPFNGFSVTYYPNGNLKEKRGYYNGKRQGVARQWYENGKLRIESFYNNNRLDSVYKSWWHNEVPSKKSHFVRGVQQGEEKQWYPNGQLAKLRHLVDGKEEGLQKGWLENGKLYVNYEAKNGRIFGMRRANACYKLEDEIVIRK